MTTRRPGAGWIVLALMLVLGLMVACWNRRPRWLDSMIGRRTTSAARPLAVNTSYLNTDPGVRYVGDAACARCHGEIARSFREHPMGRSLDRVRPTTIPGAASASFEAQGLVYEVERLGDRLLHREIRRDDRGRIVSRVEAEARYVIGSGEQAMTFLLERGDGFLFESPITWYREQQKWDLSPGYEKDNRHFERPIKPACLFCHSNRFDHVDGTENRYREPIFQGHAIGCERCHGPGELHVRKPERAGVNPSNIVNPASLQPALREAVCQQCHLQGDIRVVRAGRDLTDYRPGLPLSSVESVFVKTGNPDRIRFFGQVEQMNGSLCFRASAGRMGCISCHDPHELPDPREKASYYRDRCLNCHAEKGCSLPASERRSRGLEDRCIDCHMPRSANRQVQHTATTLHLIPRFKDSVGPPRDARPPTSASGVPLIPFHGDPLDRGGHPDQTRDFGIALALNHRAIPGMAPGAVSRVALPLLQTSLEADPDDASARAARGTLFWLLGRREESLADFRMALAKSPDREEALVAAGTRAAQAGRREEALEDFRLAIAIDPWRSDYHGAVALLHSERREWTAAIESARNSLQLNPSNDPARMILIQGLLKVRREAEARSEFQTLLDHDPSRYAALREWFARSLAP